MAQKTSRCSTAKKILSDERLRAASLILICSALFVRASIFFFRAFHAVSYPYEWSTMDGYFVFFGERLFAGAPIYSSYESLLTPFEYVPLYPVIIGALAQVFGHAVWYERCLSLLFAVGIAGLTARVVGRRVKSKAASAAAALLFFGPAAISVWYIVRGIDIFAAVAGLLGVVVLAEPGKLSPRRIAVATGIFILAFYIKQTTIFPAAAATVFVMSRDFKRGVLMGVSFVAGVAIIFLALQTLSGGWFFENAFATTARNPYAIGRLLVFAKGFFMCIPFLLPIAIFQAARGLSRKPDIWTLYLLFTIMSALLSGKAGAALSYFVPLYSAVCICVGMALGAGATTEERRALHAVVPFLILCQAALFFLNYTPVPTEAGFQQAKRLDRLIAGHPGKILSERMDSFPMLNDRDLNVEAVQLPSLIINGRFDQATLAGAIERKEFALIIYTGTHFRGLPDVRTAIFERYEVIDRIKLRLFYGETFVHVMAPR